MRFLLCARLILPFIFARDRVEVWDGSLQRFSITLSRKLHLIQPNTANNKINDIWQLGWSL